VIWVVDSSDLERMEDCRRELRELLQEEVSSFFGSKPSPMSLTLRFLGAEASSSESTRLFQQAGYRGRNVERRDLRGELLWTLGDVRLADSPLRRRVFHSPSSSLTPRTSKHALHGHHPRPRATSGYRMGSIGSSRRSRGGSTTARAGACPWLSRCRRRWKVFYRLYEGLGGCVAFFVVLEVRVVSLIEVETRAGSELDGRSRLELRVR
jgi:hypothetical protein